MLYRLESLRNGTIRTHQKIKQHFARDYSLKIQKSAHIREKFKNEKTFIEALEQTYNSNDTHRIEHFLTHHFGGSRLNNIQSLELVPVNNEEIFFYAAVIDDILKSINKGVNAENIKNVFFPILDNKINLKDSPTMIALGVALSMGIYDKSNFEGILEIVNEAFEYRIYPKYESSTNITFRALLKEVIEMIDEKRFQKFKTMTQEEYNALVEAKINEFAPLYARKAMQDLVFVSGTFITSLTSPTLMAGYIAFAAATRMAPIIMKHSLGFGNYYREESHRRNEYHFNKAFCGKNLQAKYHLFYSMCLIVLFSYALNNNMDKIFISDLDKFDDRLKILLGLVKELNLDMSLLKLLLEEIDKEKNQGIFNCCKKEFAITSGNDNRLIAAINTVAVKDNCLHLNDKQIKKLQNHIDNLIKYVKKVDPTAVAQDGSVTIATLQKHQRNFHKVLEDEIVSRAEQVEKRIEESDSIRKLSFFNPRKVITNVKSAFWRDNNLLGEEDFTVMPEIETKTTCRPLKD